MLYIVYINKNKYNLTVNYSLVKYIFIMWKYTNTILYFNAILMNFLFHYLLNLENYVWRKNTYIYHPLVKIFFNAIDYSMWCMLHRKDHIVNSPIDTHFYQSLHAMLQNAL